MAVERFKKQKPTGQIQKQEVRLKVAAHILLIINDKDGKRGQQVAMHWDYLWIARHTLKTWLGPSTDSSKWVIPELEDIWRPTHYISNNPRAIYKIMLFLCNFY